VGAPFAVLVAEQLFASGCRFLVSVTSAGQLMPRRPPPYFVLVERALRDEGTSYHYLPPGAFSMAAPDLLTLMDGAFDGLGIPIERGATWTTDAPFRETAEAVAAARARGLLAVEMEAAALYAFCCATSGSAGIPTGCRLSSPSAVGSPSAWPRRHGAGSCRPRS
jgi:uridine phosphorylase